MVKGVFYLCMSESFFTGKKLLLMGFMAVLLAAIPITVYFLQTQTKTQSKADVETIMCFALPGTNGACLTPSTPITKNVGNPITLEIYLDPQQKNSIVVATASIDYDQNLLTANPADGSGLGFTFDPVSETTPQGFTGKLVPPSYTSGNASITLSTTALKVLTQKQKIASITFKTLAQTTGNGTNITFNATRSNATPVSDPEPSGNVLMPMQPALVQIAQAGTNPTGTLTPSPIPTTTLTPVPTATLAPGAPTPTAIPNQLPVCSALNVDRTTSGPAPFSITFSANGSDANGTISSVTFDFGDGPIQTQNTGGGLGTKTAGVSIAHTYNNPGTYQAKATFTDNNGGLSAAGAACSQTITVTAASSRGGGLAAVITATPGPKMNSGPGDTIIGIGAFGALLATIGVIILRIL